MELDTITETWRRLPDWPYEASDRGRVRRIGREQPLRPTPTHHGYVSVMLCKDGRPRRRLVHLIVAEVFVGPHPGAGYCVDHVDGVRTNNRPENLEYVTSRENVLRAARSGKMRRRGGYKLSHSDVETIRALRKPGRQKGTISYRALGARFGVSHRTIFRIMNSTAPAYPAERHTTLRDRAIMEICETMVSRGISIDEIKEALRGRA